MSANEQTRLYICMYTHITQSHCWEVAPCSLSSGEVVCEAWLQEEEVEPCEQAEGGRSRRDECWVLSQQLLGEWGQWRRWSQWKLSDRESEVEGHHLPALVSKVEKMKRETEKKVD